MPAPFNNIRSKLNRAVAAYLAYLDANTCGTPDDILPANTRKAKAFPNTVCHATVATPEVPMTGTYRIPIHISVRGAAVQTVGSDSTQPDAARVAFDRRLAATFDALMQSDDGQTLRATARLITAAGRALAVLPDNPTPADRQFAQDNADMADFTCQNWFDGGFGDGQPDQEGCDWEEILIFNAVCCGANVD